jgi:putative DNA primase/helicase
MFTRCIPHNYVPGASRTRFETFLSEILGGDEELLGYVKRAAGYSVTGSVVERILFILYGPDGRNGKSTFLNLMTYALGPFAQPMRADALTQKYRGVPTEVASLRGKRFVPILETAASHRFDEALLKALTGGDRLVARKLYGQEFTFDPTHKLWLASNYLPLIRGTDDAVWERLHTVPFLKPVAKPDKQLGEKLRGEVEGFCAWLIEGALEWREVGLNPPDSVVSANRDYRESMDSIGQFIAEECVTRPEAWIGATVLHNAYVDWCGRNHYMALGTTAFGREMTKREFAAVKDGGHQHLMTRRGIGLRSKAAPGQ